MKHVLTLLFLALALVLGSCGGSYTYQVEVDPRLPPIPGAKRMPARVALVIPTELRNTRYDGQVEYPDPSWDLKASIDIGRGIEAASWQILTQYFSDVELTETIPGTEAYDLVVEPRFVSMQPRLRLVAMSVYPLVDLVVEVRASSHGQVVLDHQARALNRRGPDTQTNEGTVLSYRMATSDALAATLSEAAAALVRTPAVQRLADTRPPGTFAATQARPLPPAPVVATKRFPSAAIEARFPRGPERPDDVAVIIANADYGKLGKDIADVRPAYADAEGMRRYASQTLGIREGNIIFLKDATGAQLARVFGNENDPRGQLFDWTRPGSSRVLVYYAGHGAPGENGEAYLVPVDGDAARIHLNGYPLSRLYDNLAKLPAQSVTVVLEACFSGASPAGSVIKAASPVYLKAKLPAIPSNLTVISAGTATQMASWEEDQSSSLFTKYFLLGMAGEADKAPHGNGDAKVTLDELDRYLKQTLTYYARRYYGRDQQAQIIRGGGP
jgi:hypothetical protein